MDHFAANRRSFLAGLGISAAGLAFGGALLPRRGFAAEGGKPEVTSLEIISVRDPQHSAQLALAKELGYFSDEGLDVTLNYTVNGPDLPSLAASGKVQVLSSALEQVAALREKGLDFKWVMKLSDISNTQGVVIGNNSGIEKPADFAGKRIGMYKGAAVELAILNMTKAYGIDFGSLQFINMEPPEQALALMRGDIDVMACWEPYVSNAAKMGGRPYFTGSRSYVDGADDPKAVNWLNLATGLTTTGDFIKSSPNTLAALMRAVLKANDLLATDVNAAVDPIARNLGIPKDGLADILSKNEYDTVIDARLMDGYPVYQDWAISRGYLTTGAPMSELLDLSLLRQVKPDAVKI
ncbi:NrtA/SsuA/CpmA family ABC transporter substrate-binding protein [Kaistia geumhonensis]|uniref:NitT/TauT family transport system substrate-binding protein n=1 Tax=Kaistia geumhonensis TaxID=410839 RepID=A0ABU0M6X2_9HYPH|nr:NrtA/SsuA/CpmA family ABC transporter substrate-binding protein [Kaistia geumhonensis]MCX5478069.1 NrtA/SsuA/CpmA family ABC transporter substrate-binding protein [Kaistia geumhonensis]MDQ0516715.1 NitT/TauT family transport system substrate-binding protein [Kaistia geumhonensis]